MLSKDITGSLLAVNMYGNTQITQSF